MMQNAFDARTDNEKTKHGEYNIDKNMCAPLVYFMERKHTFYQATTLDFAEFLKIFKKQQQQQQHNQQKQQQPPPQHQQKQQLEQQEYQWQQSREKE